MIKKLIDTLNRMGDQVRLDPAQFDDPVATRTLWTPLKRGGTNFKTHSLKQVHRQRLEFRTSVGMWLFAGLFAMIGILVFTGFAVSLTRDGSNTDGIALILMPLFALAFGGAGIFMLRQAMVPAVFDLAHGYFCKNRKKPEHTFDTSTLKNYVTLDQVHALQIISEHCSGKKNSYHSYELNLVLKDGERMNVIDHGSRQAIRTDGQAVADFLGIPLWDAL